MRMKPWNAALSLLLVGILILLAGCQSVGNVDVNKALVNSISVKSAESSEMTTIELIQNPTADLTPEEKQMLALFSKIKLVVDDVKQQDQQHVSMKGRVEYSGGSIPFEMTATDQEYIFLPEGAKKPIVIRTGFAALDKEMASVPSAKQMKEQMDQLKQRIIDAVPNLSPFLVRNLPNPDRISVKEVSDQVHGEQLTLQKIHAEIDGKELVGLLKGFLTNILADEKGLKDFIGQLYDVYIPFFKQMAQDSSSSNQSKAKTDQFMPYLENKTLAVEFMYTFIKTNLEQWMADYDQNVAKMLASPRGSSADDMLNNKLVYKTDIYIDRDFMPRKSATELSLTLPEGTKSGIQGIKVTAEGELWNINRPIQMDQIDVSAGFIDLNSYQGRMSPSKIVASLDPNSKLYKLLKEDLHVTKKEINMLMGDSAYNMNDTKPYNFKYTSPYNKINTKPYNDEGTIMVPARFVSEKLDADVEWEGSTNQIKVTDPLSGTVIILTIGSREATVNGKTVLMEKEAVLKNNTTFIPVRFIAENMGAKVSWDQDKQQVSITRD